MARDNSDAFAALQAQIDRLRALGTVARDIAPEVARELRAQLERNIERGVGPDGEAWQRNADGSQPLRTAAKALTVRAIGTAVVATLHGPVAMHHLGTAAGRIRRRILPSRRMPQPLIDAIRRAVQQRLERV